MGKIGKCPQCPKGSRDVLLIGELCANHFYNREDTPRAVHVTKKDEKKEERITLSKWFAIQETQIPAKCENCKKKISIPASLTRRTAVAHIVPKKTIKSVATHLLNRWFGCWQCHTDYDQKPADEVANMPVVKICRERFKQFEHLIPDNEKKYVPKFLLND